MLIANSRYTAERIKKYYRKDAEIVYPPALALCTAGRDEIILRGERKHFLVVSRLARSKKIEPVIEAFNKLGFPLVIVGSGRDEERLRRIASPSVSFVGAPDDTRLRRYYREARAVLFPSEEDFGMVAVEALSLGTPVIAYEHGGIREILRVGETGEVFRSQTPEVIAEAVKRFAEKESAGGYPAERLCESIAHFSEEAFIRSISRSVAGIDEP